MYMELDNIFKYHPPKGNQTERYEKIRNAAKEYAKVVLENTPVGFPDTELSIIKLRESVMFANASIAINESEGDI